MSRTLARLRAATGDQLLVRAGRGLVATPHAEALRTRVRGLAEEVKAVLSPSAVALDLAQLQRTFTLRTNEGFVEAFAARLVTTVMAEAPGVRLRFAPKADKDVRPLREGLIDLDIGVLGESGPEVLVQALFRDRFIGVARHGHPLFAAGDVSPERYAACGHVVTSRRGQAIGPIDAALAALGLTRKVLAIVPSFPAALAIASASDLVAAMPHSFVQAELERGKAGQPRVVDFALPVATPPITVSQMWHPRIDADPAHRWLRGRVLALCRDPAPAAAG